MNAEPNLERAAYYREAESWAADRERGRFISLRAAWIVAGVASTIALFEAIALITLTPLKTVVPYTLLVDRQTGFVQELKPLDRQSITADAALTRSFLAQYVIARESFDIDSLRDDYRKVALWSEGDARNRYMAAVRASNPSSPLATLPRKALVQVEIRSISSLSDDSALVRFVTTRTDPGGRARAPTPWAAVIKYRYSAGNMSAADRLANPLGFQVARYRRDAEIPIAPVPDVPTNPASVTNETQAVSETMTWEPAVRQAWP
ncbi:VirB8/TrbF family protein [Sphingobium sp. AP49]|uniref:virB8 family protein n=1 Tax=Sphingobium sp. AP49 TaxID=1144307 RepID=UPI00026ED772|nr:VirB8/TrbF family protein [Sphingobium sp. AP49]WHO38393.1 VirB8/TrbF family protein [Sphingobium sp. AP49]